MTLNELTAAEKILLGLLDDPESADPTMVEECIGSLLEQKAEKVDAYARVLRNLAMREDALKAEAKRLAEKASALANSQVNLKARLMAYMDAEGLREMQGQTYKLALQTRKASRCEVTESDIDKWVGTPYVKTAHSWVLSEIKAADGDAPAHELHDSKFVVVR